MEYKSFAFDYKVEDSPRTVEGYAAIYGIEDSGNGYYSDVIEKGACYKALNDPSHRRRIRYLWDHNASLPPLGPIQRIEEDSKGLLFKAKLTQGVSLADEIYALLKDRAIEELSIGYKTDAFTIEVVGGKTIRHLKEISPFDISHVVWGMNEHAQVYNVKAKKFELKKAIPYHDHPLADKDTAWDAGAQVKNATVDDLRQMCAWYDAENPDLKGSYKLPHHMLDGYKTVWRGVAAAMAALFGARGGVDIPTEDRRAVYNHLARHYREFDEEPPEFKTSYTEAIDEYDRFMSLVEELKAGKQISKTNAAKIISAMHIMAEMLMDAGHKVRVLEEENDTDEENKKGQEGQKTKEKMIDSNTLTKTSLLTRSLLVRENLRAIPR